MKIIPFIYDDVDELTSNTYLLIDSSNNSLLIDPGRDNQKIIDYIERNHLYLKGILLTHGHFDHIRGVDRIIDKFNIPCYIHFQDEIMLDDPSINGSISLFNEKVAVKHKCETITDNDKINLLDEEISVIATPFHTIGSVCYYIKAEQILFTGDTLFKAGFGRYDLPHSDR